MRRTIPYRETLTPDIFDEMTENYPLVSIDFREYKQTLQYFSFPANFDFVKFRFDCEDNDVNSSEAFSVWLYLSKEMCADHGYYCDTTKSLMSKMSFALELSEEKINPIIDALIDTGYLYNFDGRFTNIPAVRTFECVQSTRIINRTRRKHAKTNENAVVSDERPETATEIPTSTEAQEEAPEPEIGKEELEFFNGTETEDIEKKNVIFF